MSRPPIKPIAAGVTAATLLGAAYSPPVSAPAPPVAPALQGQGANVEARTVRADARAGFALGAVFDFLSLGAYIFSRPWTAADVYVDVSQVTGDWQLLSVYIYAVSQQGSRVLAASGRLKNGQDTALWIASARGPVQERYQVEYRFDGTINPPGAITIAGTLILTCVGSDKATGVGRTPFGAVVFPDRVNQTNESTPVLFEVLRVNGTRAPAEFSTVTPLYLALYEDGPAGIPASPVLVWQLPPDGPGVDAEVGIRLQIPRLRITADPEVIAAPLPGIARMVLR